MPDDRSRATVQKPSSGLAPSQPRIGEREHPRKRALISPTSIKEPVTQIRSEGAAERFAPASASAGVAATCAAGAQFGKIPGQHDCSRRIVCPVHQDRRRLTDNFQPAFPDDMLQPGANRFFRDRQASLSSQFDQRQGAGNIVQLKPSQKRTG